MQLVRPIFFFFGFWGEGERENFLFFLQPWHGGDNHVAIYLIVRR
jgi:hypothetical protein